MTRPQTALREGEPDVRYRMTLFVAGSEPNSRIARGNLAELCDTELAGRYEIEVVDVLQDFAAAAENNVLVTPTLLITEPAPAITVVGNLSDRAKLRAALRLGESR